MLTIDQIKQDVEAALAVEEYDPQKHLCWWEFVQIHDEAAIRRAKRIVDRTAKQYNLEPCIVLAPNGTQHVRAYRLPQHTVQY